MTTLRAGVLAAALLVLAALAMRHVAAMPWGAPLALGAALAAWLAWLRSPAPWGGGMALRQLLVPDAGRRLAAGLAGAALWALGAGWLVLALLTFDIADRPPVASPGAMAAAGVALAWLHGALCLGVGLGGAMRRGRDAEGVLLAMALSQGLALPAPLLLGAPASLVAAAGVAAALATLAMAIPVLLGGRIWPVLLGSALAWTIPCAVAWAMP